MPPEESRELRSASVISGVIELALAATFGKRAKALAKGDTESTGHWPATSPEVGAVSL